MIRKNDGKSKWDSFDFSIIFSETSVFQAISTATDNRVDTIILDIDNLELKEIEFIDVVRKINSNLFILISFSDSNREKAFKYIEGGADNNVNATFYDSGRGIPSDVNKSIFDPFFVVNEEERGMRLGLCASNDIFKKYGCVLTVRRQFGQGHNLSICFTQ